MLLPPNGGLGEPRILAIWLPGLKLASAMPFRRGADPPAANQRCLGLGRAVCGELEFWLD